MIFCYKKATHLSTSSRAKGPLLDDPNGAGIEGALLDVVRCWVSAKCRFDFDSSHQIVAEDAAHAPAGAAATFRAGCPATCAPHANGLTTADRRPGHLRRWLNLVGRRIVEGNHQYRQRRRPESGQLSRRRRPQRIGSRRGRRRRG